MKINIKPDYCRYIVNEEQRKVVCIIDNTEDLVRQFIGWPFEMKMAMPDKVIDKIALPKRFTGIATCAPEDEWDVEVGKALAFSRAKYKLGVSFFKRANYMVNEIDAQLSELLDAFNSYGEHLEKNQEKRRSWLVEKIGCDITFGGKPVVTEDDTEPADEVPVE